MSLTEPTDDPNDLAFGEDDPGSEDDLAFGENDPGSGEGDPGGEGDLDTGEGDPGSGEDDPDTGGGDPIGEGDPGTGEGDPTSSDGDPDREVIAMAGDDPGRGGGDPTNSDRGTGDSTVSGTGPSASDSDPGPPYLIVDQYSGDSGPRPQWETLVSTSGFYGVILKAMHGSHFNDGGWFKKNWPAVRDAGGDRYPHSWFRGAYLFLLFHQSGVAQADAYLKAIDGAGGWDSGDILPIIDVELGQATSPNFTATAQQIVKCTTQCADRIREVTGQRVVLYGRTAMRERNITNHMGCDVVWNPSYTAHMVTNGLQSWDLEDIVLWQYCGDNKAVIANLPHTVKGFRQVDISVYVKGKQRPTLQMMRESLLRV
jgi:GH25 family lysozyme M1 (1,4-beta-N-acetylmuramidase)